MTKPKLAACPVDGRPATGQQPYPYLCWSCAPQEEDMFPVLVTYTHEHVVWVRAENQKAAVEQMNHEPYETTSDTETLLSAYWNSAAPSDRWDWDKVYDGEYSMPYQGLECDAHVATRREWFRKLERAHEAATVEHETRENVPAEQRRTCALCKQWREAAHEDSFHHQSEVRWAERETAAVAR